MDEEESNYWCLTLLLLRVGNPCLRRYFKNRWDAAGRYSVPWTDCAQNGADLRWIFSPLYYEEDKVASGDTSQWDLSLLVKVLLYSRPPFVAKPNNDLVTALETLKEMRGSLFHSPSPRVKASDFQRLWIDGCNALSLFGATVEEFDNVEQGMIPVTVMIHPTLDEMVIDMHDADRQRLENRLPFQRDGYLLFDVRGGSLVFVLKLSSASSLKRLWQSYKDGALKEKLKRAFNEMEELMEVSKGEEIDVEVTIDEKEYHKVLLYLTPLDVKETVDTKKDPEERNYFCIALLLFRVGNPCLRGYFKTKWDAAGRYSVPWTDCAQNGADLLRMFKPQPLENDKVTSGDTSKWDFSLLVRALLQSRPPFVVAANLVTALETLKEMRNKLCYSPSPRVEASDFQRSWSDGCSALRLFGAKDVEFDKVKQDVQKPWIELFPKVKQCADQDPAILEILVTSALYKQDMEKANILPNYPTSFGQNHDGRFLNDEKYTLYIDMPSSDTEKKNPTAFLYPGSIFPVAGNAFPVLMDKQPCEDIMAHWKKWLPDFPEPVFKTIDEGIEDKDPLITIFPMQRIPKEKHAIDPDTHYHILLKSTIPEMGAPCPRYYTQDDVVFPCMVKVDQSLGGYGNHVCKNQKDLRDALETINRTFAEDVPYVITEFIQDVEETLGCQFYLNKKGEVHWLGAKVNILEGCTWVGSEVDWDVQEEHKGRVYDSFVIPVAEYLHKKGYFGIAGIDIICTSTSPSGDYLVDVNARLTGFTPHALIAPVMARDGLTKSLFKTAVPHDCSTEELIRKANSVNETNKGKILILNSMDVDEGCVAAIVAFAKIKTDIKKLFDCLTV